MRKIKLNETVFLSDEESLDAWEEWTEEELDQIINKGFRIVVKVYYEMGLLFVHSGFHHPGDIESALDFDWIDLYKDSTWENLIEIDDPDDPTFWDDEEVHPLGHSHDLECQMK